MEYINELIDLDIRNNSAWNQRYFYLSNKSDLNKEENHLTEEIEYCLSKIDLCVDNESSWNYLRALVARNKNVYPDNVIQFCRNKLSMDKEDEKSPFLIAFLVDYNSIKSKELLKSTKDSNELKTYAKESVELLESLASKYDTIRANYWNYLISKWKNQFSEYVN